MRKSMKGMLGVIIFTAALSSSAVMAEPVAEKVDYGKCFCYWGDVNGDEKVGLDDATGILKGALGIEDIDERYVSFFESESPVLDDAQNALKTALGIEMQEIVTVGESVRLDIEKEYIVKELENVENGISTGAYAMDNEEKMEIVLSRLTNSFGVGNIICHDLEKYAEETTLDTVDESDNYVPVLIVANMESYFDLGVNIHLNGFNWFDTSGNYNGAATVGNQGCFTAQEEVWCAHNGENLEVFFSEDCSGKEKMTGAENANLYASIVEIPRWVAEESDIDVYWQSNLSKVDLLLGENYDLNVIKEYICADKCSIEEKGISTGKYIVEDAWFKEKLLLRLADSIGEESEIYQEIKSYLDKVVSSGAGVSEEVPVLIVADMELYFDLGTEMYDTGFDWFDTSAGAFDMAAVGPQGYYTARNKVKLDIRPGYGFTIRFEEDDSIATPLTGKENENLYLCLVTLPRKFIENYKVCVEGQSDYAGNDIYLQEIDFVPVYAATIAQYIKAHDNSMAKYALNTDTLDYVSEEQIEDVFTMLKEKYDLNVYEASTEAELKALDIVDIIRGEWSFYRGSWIHFSSAKVELGRLIVSLQCIGKEGSRGLSFSYALSQDNSEWCIENYY